MKNHILSIFLTTAAILFFSRYGNGQNRILYLDNSEPGAQRHLFLNKLSTRAVRSFQKEFPLVENESWVMIADDYTANFTREGVQWFVRYDKNGYWSCTIKIYHEQQMPVYLRWLIKKKYPKYSVTLVEEEILKDRSYSIIQITNETSFKRLYFSDGSLTIIEAREKWLSQYDTGCQVTVIK